MLKHPCVYFLPSDSKHGPSAQALYQAAWEQQKLAVQILTQAELLNLNRPVVVLDSGRFWDLDLAYCLSLVAKQEGYEFPTLGLSYDSKQSLADKLLVDDQGRLKLKTQTYNDIPQQAYFSGGFAILPAHQLGLLSQVNSWNQLLEKLLAQLAQHPVWGLPLLGRIFRPQNLGLEELKLWNTRRKGCLFLDRDGILNKDKGYIGDPSQVEFIEASLSLFTWARHHDLYIAVLTNQSGIGRGYYGTKELEQVHQTLIDRLKQHGHSVDLWLHSPDHAKHGQGTYLCKSLSRKPGPGMAIAASYQLPIDPKKCLMIGDKESDALHLPGLRSLLLRGAYPIGGQQYLAFTYDSFQDLHQALQEIKF